MLIVVIVPNYVPDPLEVPGNVTEQPYLVRLGFIRAVTITFLGGLFATAAIVGLGPPAIGLPLAFGIFVALLIGLEIWRIASRGKDIEGLVSQAFLPVLWISSAMALAEVSRSGWPVWQALAGPVCLAVYTMLCGRDYSFVGAFLISLIASSVAVAAISESIGLSAQQTTFALVTNAALLAYVVYDLASLLSRRRVGESVAAVTDLYRDVFNVFGYVIRVARHWRKHRIWSMPSSFELIKKGKG